MRQGRMKAGRLAEEEEEEEEEGEEGEGRVKKKNDLAHSAAVAFWKEWVALVREQCHATAE